MEKEKIELIKDNINAKIRQKKRHRKVKRSLLEQNRMKKLETEYKLKVSRLTHALKFNERMGKLVHRNQISRKTRKKIEKKPKTVSRRKRRKRMKRLSVESFRKSVYNHNTPNGNFEFLWKFFVEWLFSLWWRRVGRVLP